MSPARIAIAEPDPAIAALFAAVVARLGHQPIVVRPSADTATADVLLLEPADTAGLELASELRRRDPGLQIVCVSTRSPNEEALLLDPIRFLVKPVRLDDLRAAVRAAARAASNAPAPRAGREAPQRRSSAHRLSLREPSKRPRQ